jgi:hypothetical protein
MVPVAVIWIVEFVGDENVPATLTFPATLIVLAAVLVMVPEEKAKLPTVHEAGVVPTVTVPPLIVNAEGPVFRVAAPLIFRVPAVTVSPPVAFRVPAPVRIDAPAEFSVSPPEKVSVPEIVRESVVVNVCATAVVSPLTVKAWPFKLKAFPVSVVVPALVSVTVPVELVTASVPPVLLIVVPAPIVSVVGAPAAVELRSVVPALVNPPLTVKLVVVPPPSVKVSPDATFRLAKVAVPVRLTPPVPVIVTTPKV